MEWKPILTYKWNAWALGMIDDISRCIMRQDLTARAQGLLYGNAGTDVYLFHAADLKNDDKLFDWATDLLGLILKQVEIKIKHVPQKTDVIDVSLGQGLAGVGWSMSYLLNSERVEGDMNSIFGAADAAIFRRMVTIVLEPLLQELSSSVGIGLYAVSRDSRLSHEFLRRYILELYGRIKQSETRNKILAQSSGTIEGLIRLTGKISDKYSDIAYTLDVRDYLFDLFTTIPMQNLDLRSLFLLIDRESYRTLAKNELNQRARWTVENVKKLKIGAGLEQGIVAMGHTFNRIFQHTGDEQCRDAAVVCFKELLERANQTVGGSEAGLWNTSSRGIWCRHYALLNGIAGIGLALMAAVSNEEPTWDEILYLS